MKLAYTTGATACCRWSSLLKGSLACVVAMAAVGFGVSHLSADLWSAFAGEDESTTQAVAASNQSLPADAPAVSLVRSQDLQAQSSKAASASQQSVVLLDDWTYTQSTGSPFFFTATDFDFFNPLFAFNCCCQSSNIQTSSSPFSTPFGFSISPSSGFPVIITGTGSGTPIVFTNGTGTTTLSPGFLNGASIFVTVTTSTGVFPIGLGSAGFSHRHAFTPIIVVINITIIVNVNVSPSK